MFKVLVDNDVLSAADFAEGAVKSQVLKWGSSSVQSDVHGFRRVPLDPNPESQLQKDALFTVSRLAREGRLELYTYSELSVEQWRRPRARDLAGNAFRGYEFKHCMPALERSDYYQTIDMDAWLSKGGKKDKKAGVAPKGVSQIEFCKLLLGFQPEIIEQLIQLGPRFVRTDFDKESLYDLDWFKRATRVAPSNENLPDFFHLWTSRRNDMDVFLTLEVKMPKWSNELRQGGLLGKLQILRPTELTTLLGASELDAVPLESDRFYSFGELMGKKFTGWNGKISSQ